MNRSGYLRGLAILAFALLFMGAVFSVDWPSPAGFDEQNDTVSNEEVGRTMFGVSGASGYGLIMVFVGVLLLVALLGGIFLAKEEREEDQ